MSREVHVPFYERLGVQFPRPTHRFARSFRDVEDLDYLREAAAD